MTRATWYVEAKFDGSDWTDITPYVSAVNLKRGRSDDLDNTEAGTAVMVLKNSDGRFTPENSQGAYHPDVKPGVKVRIQVAGGTGAAWDSSSTDWDDGEITWSGHEVRSQIVGEAVSWEPRWSPGRVDTVVLKVVDGFEQLTNVDVSYAHREDVLADPPDAYWTLGQSSTVLPEEQGIEAFGLRPIGGDAATALVAGGSGSRKITGLDDRGGIMESNPPTAWSGESNDLTLSCVFQWETMSIEDVLLAFSGGPGEGWVFSVAEGRMTFAISDGSGSETLQTSVLSWSEGTTYQVGMWWDQSAKAVTFYRNGSVVDTDTATIDPVVAAHRLFGLGSANNGSNVVLLSEFALWTSDASDRMAVLGAAVDGYASDLPGERITRVLDWAGWPDADRDLDDGVTPAAAVESGTALQSCQDAGSADGGVFYIAKDGTATFQGRRDRWESDTEVAATFDDDGTDTPYGQVGWRFDTTYLHNDVTVNSNTQGTSDGRAKDEDSRDTYGKRPLSISTISNNSADNAARARWELARRKAPHLRLEDLSFVVGRDLQAETAAALELQDLVTVNRRPGSGQDDISVDMRVASIEHDVTPGGPRWEVKLGLLEATTDQPGVYGTAKYGEDVYGY